MKNPKLNAKNPHFGNRYATLDEVLRVVSEEVALKYITQGCEVQDGNIMFVTRVISDPPGWGGSEVSFPFPNVNKAQELGSALTYCRRYGLLLLFNLVGEEDDDGNAAQGRPSPKGKAGSTKAPAKGKKSGFKAPEKF
jgi:hypothetical protein